MSLFKTEDLWSTSLDNDLFDLGCLKVANVGVNKRKMCSIITGSYNGFLRVHNPSFSLDAPNTASPSFKASDLICELTLPGPVLQIETGKFVSTTNKEHIAVLLPKKLIVYEAIEYEGGNIEHGNQYGLKLIYEHTLQRTSYNMCKGSFGGAGSSAMSNEPPEFLCVQSMDGVLSIFEYESFALSCYLPKVLIPGPFKYISKTDSFITVSSSWELESYKYQTLAMSAKSLERSSPSDAAATSTNKPNKRILPDYSYNIGEAALDMEVYYGPGWGQSNCSVLVLGERNIFCFNEMCMLRYMKKFEFNPSSFCVYSIYSASSGAEVAGAGDSLNFLLATHSKMLFVHQDARVKWASQLDHVPVQLAVAKLNNLNGVIVSLSEDGKLKCSYLGTEPALLNPILNEEASRPFNFESAEREYRALQAQIINAIVNTGSIFASVGGASGKKGLILDVTIPSRLDEGNTLLSRANQETELRDPVDQIPSLTCRLTLKSIEPVQNIKVSVSCSLPIVAVPESVSFVSIGSVPIEQDICFYMKTKHIPSSLNVTVCASYTNAINAAARVTEAKFRLPLKLIMKSGQQVAQPKLDQSNDEKTMKQAAGANNLKKITIETNRPCVNLVDIFPEFAGSYIQANGNIIAGQYYGHAYLNITLQGSKSGANRYRIQSDTYDSLWIILQEFVSRLDAHFKKSGQQLEMVYHDALPTDEFRLVIDRHLELRQSLEMLKDSLEKCCVQFRAIQKRLLIKFKDKSPTSLDNMDALLEATYRQIASISDSYLLTQRELSLVTNSLNCMGSLYVLLISLAFKFTKESFEILEAAMTSHVGDTSELGWEEIVNASVSNMLKIALSKSSKEANAPNQSQLKLPQDSSKLEKQLKSFISKLQNGASLLPNVYRVESNSKEADSATTASVKDEEQPQRRTQPQITPRDVNSKDADVKSRSKAFNNDDDNTFEGMKNFDINEYADNYEQTALPKSDVRKLPTFDELMQEQANKTATGKYNFDLDD